MKKLPVDWLTTGWVDFEYKKYQLLAYLQQVDRAFERNRLYPPLEDLEKQHHQIEQVIAAQKSIKDHFSSALTKVDWKSHQLKFDTTQQVSSTMQELESITRFALPKLEKSLTRGKEYYQSVKDQLKVEPIGLQPLYQKEGYLILQPGAQAPLYIYRYRARQVSLTGDDFHNLQTWFLYREIRSISHSLRQVKIDLLRRFRNLPNPATWFCGLDQSVPLPQTLLPISRQFLWNKVID